MNSSFARQQKRPWYVSLFLVSAVCMFLAGVLTGCAFFETPQERSGINPKPFNSQASWESSPYKMVN